MAGKMYTGYWTMRKYLCFFHGYTASQMVQQKDQKIGFEFFRVTVIQPNTTGPLADHFTHRVHQPKRPSCQSCHKKAPPILRVYSTTCRP